MGIKRTLPVQAPVIPTASEARERVIKARKRKEQEEIVQEMRVVAEAISNATYHRKTYVTIGEPLSAKIAMKLRDLGYAVHVHAQVRGKGGCTSIGWEKEV